MEFKIYSLYDFFIQQFITSDFFPDPHPHTAFMIIILFVPGMGIPSYQPVSKVYQGGDDAINFSFAIVHC